MITLPWIKQYWAPHSLWEFLELYQREINETLKRNNFNLRKALLNDVPMLDELAYSRYSEDIVKEMSHFATYRFIKYWNVFVIENSEKKIIGCIYEQQLQGSVSFATRLIVSKEYEGLWIPKILTQQTYISAINSWSKIRKGIIARDNIPSHIIHLNKLGWSYTSLIENDLDGVGDHFEAEIPLSFEWLSHEGFDDIELKKMIIEWKKTWRYKLIDINDLVWIKNFFEENPNGQIIALIRPELINENFTSFLCKTSNTHLNSNQISNNTNIISWWWISLEAKNYGEPTSHKIQKNPLEKNSNLPQAWLINWVWRYNLIAMREERLFTKKELPTTSNWLDFINGIDWNMEAKNKFLMQSNFMEEAVVWKDNINIQLSKWWTGDGDIIFIRKDYLHPWSYQDHNGAFPIRFLAS